MPRHSETLLLFESRPYARNEYAAILNQLGYWRLLYTNYNEGSGFSPGIAPFDAVVGVWTDADVSLDRFARAVANATSFPHVRGALIVSPFTTEDNVRLLARSGAKSWARTPIAHGELSARLGVLLNGDRRSGADRRLDSSRKPAADRRHAPLFPMAVPA